MTEYKCKNCAWQGEEPLGNLRTCPVCGDNTDEIAGEVAVKNPMDLDGDGDVDANDRSIAAKVMSSGRKSRKKRK